MAENHRHRALALIAGGFAALASGAFAPEVASAAEAPVVRPAAAARPVAARGPVGRARAVRSAEARPLTIRRRAGARPVEVAAAPDFGDDYLVRQHGWDDPRLYRFGPFRTGGDVFYGDQAGDTITRGNAGLGQVAGYGAARGGFGGPHFDAVGGFHDGPGPDAGIDDDYASGSLSRPDYAFAPHYPSVTQRVASLDAGVVSRGPNPSGRRLVAEGRSTTVSFEEAKARFAAPMRRQAPVEAGFDNGGIGSIGIGDDAF